MNGSPDLDDIQREMTMRAYPLNSPLAAARLVALAALADGYLSRREIETLERLKVHEKLGLSRAQFHEVIQDLSEDLLATAFSPWGTGCEADDEVLVGLLKEIDSPELRKQTLELCVAVADADDHLCTGEINFIATAASRWILQSPSTKLMN
jgi:uncharacterized tellurite resistance protein B-like protein